MADVTQKNTTRQPRSTSIHIGRPVMIITSAMLHLILAFCLFWRAANTDLLALSGLDGMKETLGLDAVQLASLLAIAAVVALVGVAIEERVDIRICTLLVLPQYSFMLWALARDVLLVAHEQYSIQTGQPYNWTLALAVVAPVMCIAIGHTAAFLERYVLRWLR